MLMKSILCTRVKNVSDGTAGRYVTTLLASMEDDCERKTDQALERLQKAYIIDGFKNLKNKDFPVVITTAYNQYALQALKNEAIDYLLKPIDTDDLEITIAKIKRFNAKNLTVDRLEKILLNFND